MATSSERARHGAPATDAGPAQRQFLVSQGLGQFADGMTAMVLAHLLLVSGSGVEPDHLLETLAVAAVPYAVIGPVSGALADRWPRRTALGVVHACRAALTLGALLAVHLSHRPLGLAIATGLLCCARFVYQLRAASLPAIAARGRLVELDARSLLVGMVAGTGGAALGTVGAAVAPSVLLVVGVGAQVVAGLGFASMRSSLGGGRRRREPSLVEVGRHLGRLLLGTPTRAATLATSANRCLLGAVFAAGVLVAANRLQLGASGYVAALAVTGAGSLAGTFTAPVIARRLGLRGLTTLAFATPAISLTAAAASGTVSALAVASAASFFAFQNLRVTADAAVQTAVQDEVRARVFSIYDATYNLAYFGGAAIVLASGLGDRPTVAFLAVAAAAGGVALCDLVARVPRLIGPPSLRSPA